jgi:serine/threonine protein phosphatase PrpC
MNRNLHFTAIAWRSEVGLQREGNEDSGLAATDLIAVADGMGGYVGGEIASSTVISELKKLHPVITNPEIDTESKEDLFRAAISTMDLSLKAVSEQRPELHGMGTTLTSVAIINAHAVLLHIGDSRAYRIRGKKITQISHDHTVVQELIDQGRLSPDEVAEHPQRSLLTQALMGNLNVDSALIVFPLEVGDIYLVSSDGLTTVVDESKIASAFSTDLQSGIDSLIDLTYKNGAPDNVTIIAAQVGENPLTLEPITIGAAS